VEPFADIQKEMALEAATRGEAVEEVRPVIDTLHRSVASSGIAEHVRVDDPKDGSVKAAYHSGNFRAQLTAFIRQGVHGPEGPKFSFHISSEAQIPSMNAARSRTGTVFGCAVGAAALLFVILLAVGIVVVRAVTGYFVFTPYYVVIVAFPALLVGGLIAAVINGIMVGRADRRAKADDSVQLGMAGWGVILAEVGAAIDNHSVSGGRRLRPSDD